MVILHDSRLLFIHIPRTSGVAVRDAMLQARNDAQSFHAWYTDREMAGDVHITARDALTLFPGYRTFAIIRNPWHCTESIWRWRMLVGLRPDLHLHHHGVRFVDHCKQIVQWSYDEYVSDFFEEFPDGYYRHWCDDDTMCFRYEDRPYHAIGELIQCRLNVRQQNASIVPPPKWTQSAIDIVARHCVNDVETFGYAKPTIAELESR